MSNWKKVKSLFWVGTASDGVPAAAGGGSDLSDEEFAAFLGQQEGAVPPGPADAVEASSLPAAPAADGAVEIDFQAQYDQAGIPNTDEVEQLEAFLTRLEASLPLASKVAAAEAFLGAVGKDRAAVLRDAERKIKRVRGLLAAQEAESQRLAAQEQSEIEALARAIDEHRKRIEDLTRLTEGVRRSCQAEETRLQAVHIFFGTVGSGGAGRSRGAPEPGKENLR